LLRSQRNFILRNRQKESGVWARESLKVSSTVEGKAIGHSPRYAKNAWQ